MQLHQLRVHQIGPFDELELCFANEDQKPRALTVLLGGGGVGKTTLLQAIAHTRPGYATVCPRRRKTSAGSGFAVADWLLGQDDPSRPHTLRVASPNCRLEEEEREGMLRRKEQALYDRKAAEGGHVVVHLPACRWFSRTPVHLSSPERSVLRYDVRSNMNFEDASRSDLCRDTKQALVYTNIAANLAVAEDEEEEIWPHTLDAAMRNAVDALVGLVGFRYLGAHPLRLEPMFRRDEEVAVSFDDLPTAARHLVAMAALPVRGLMAGHRRKDPRHGQGLILIDSPELHLPEAVQRQLPEALHAALPNCQWVLASSSLHVASGCASDEVLALKHLPSESGIQLYAGQDALIH